MSPPFRPGPGGHARDTLGILHQDSGAVEKAEAALKAAATEQQAATIA